MAVADSAALAVWTNSGTTDVPSLGSGTADGDCVDEGSGVVGASVANATRIVAVGDGAAADAVLLKSAGSTSVGLGVRDPGRAVASRDRRALEAMVNPATLAHSSKQTTPNPTATHTRPRGRVEVAAAVAGIGAKPVFEPSQFVTIRSISDGPSQALVSSGAIGSYSAGTRV